ncbi:ParB/RepB/Spo0J family partition protein (plasmid) [Methylocystis sp. MJC1]|uniref:ParB/RepB/Spo0J family partition protein n=1 Tax=Methylocystis sp. MJC1 TaxID=2654282 RepID=UPI0013EA68AA|nr:ParB/RepB/Spo0J family partition protein [Methylocystis sp. MJC1]KAF2991458.1 Chromosome-partitioning protein Spo0J [Methylocystis sp. MJC1]MBU6529430.1 ParB/RepB/Spo0J family partition protein [Methylocystis sp. MJC1]UZX14301.1 ParB/RepB/Spo0J family partition protein [Methylocystis sp. MJC1]
MSKITLVGASDIALDKLVASDANVRRIKAGVSVEDLAEDIARRGLLQSLSVRPLVDGDGVEKGKYTVTAGGRRLAALKLLVKQKRLAKNAPVPCIVKTDGVEEEDSLAENTMREALHPLDQFRAFKNLHEQGLSIDDIAARFFVGAQIVRQRLKLAAASPKLLDLYVGEELSLDQLMAFCVTDDHARQEEVWDALSRSYDKGPYAIRRQLTQGAVRASDKRGQFVGIEAYETAGGVVLRDLFNRDDGGWLQDAALLDRLARENLERAAEEVRAEGWKWSEIAIDFPYGHTTGLRRLPGTQAPITEEEQARYDAAVAEYNRLSEEQESADEIPEDADQRMAELEVEIASIDERPSIYDRAEIARAGVFVSIDHDGRLKVERGFVRPEDEARKEGGALAAAGELRSGAQSGADGAMVGADTETGLASPEPTEEEVETSPKLSGLMVVELSAHRTVAMRLGLASNPQAAFLAATHALALNAFYSASSHSCLDLSERSVTLGSHAPGIGDSLAARTLFESFGNWQMRLPADPANLWSWLLAQDESARAELFALCIGLSVNALNMPWERRTGVLQHADRLAEHIALDMRASWSATVESFFGKVTKAHILAAVREAKGDETAEMIAHLKKADMAAEAERLLQGTGWLPEGLRTPNLDAPPLIQEPGAPAGDPSTTQDEGLPAFLEESIESPDYPAAAE